jgi:hypothetical protein
MLAVMQSQFADSVEFGAVTPSRKTMENRAARYRNLAAEVREKANNLSDDKRRQGMLMAAEVWDRLAALDERATGPSASQRSAALHLN